MAEKAPFDESHSVTHLIQRLSEEDEQAANGIWQRYFARLLPLARAKLKSSADRSIDEEDILVSVFDRFFAAAGEEKFARLNDRADLWQILVMLTERKVIDQFRRNSAAKRGSGERVNEGDLSEFNLQEIKELVDRDPSPEFLAAFNDNLSVCLERLSQTGAQEVAVLKLEGYTNQEIAQRLEISLSSVERKLRVIREAWEK